MCQIFLTWNFQNCSWKFIIVKCITYDILHIIYELKKIATLVEHNTLQLFNFQKFII